MKNVDIDNNPNIYIYIYIFFVASTTNCAATSNLKIKNPNKINKTTQTKLQQQKKIGKNRTSNNLFPFSSIA